MNPTRDVICDFCGWANGHHKPDCGAEVPAAQWRELYRQALEMVGNAISSHAFNCQCEACLWYEVPESATPQPEDPPPLPVKPVEPGTEQYRIGYQNALRDVHNALGSDFISRFCSECGARQPGVGERHYSKCSKFKPDWRTEEVGK
jgi:hypothetical protein